MADDPYVTIRDANLLGPFIGARVVDITQQDEEQWEEGGGSFVALHFDNGGTVVFPISDPFHIWWPLLADVEDGVIDDLDDEGYGLV